MRCFMIGPDEQLYCLVEGLEKNPGVLDVGGSALQPILHFLDCSLDPADRILEVAVDVVDNDVQVVAGVVERGDGLLVDGIAEGRLDPVLELVIDLLTPGIREVGHRALCLFELQVEVTDRVSLIRGIVVPECGPETAVKDHDPTGGDGTAARIGFCRTRAPTRGLESGGGQDDDQAAQESNGRLSEKQNSC